MTLTRGGREGGLWGKGSRRCRRAGCGSGGRVSRVGALRGLTKFGLGACPVGADLSGGLGFAGAGRSPGASVEQAFVEGSKGAGPRGAGLFEDRLRALGRGLRGSLYGRVLEGACPGEQV